MTLVANYSGIGLAGRPNPDYSGGSNQILVPPGAGGALGTNSNNSSPNYYVGLNMQIPLRNRVAKADQFRAELEYRQNEAHAQQQKKLIRINVRNAEYTLEQSAARVRGGGQGPGSGAKDLRHR